MDEPGIYTDCQFAAMTILRAAGTGGEFAESDIPRDGTMAATVSTVIQRHGSLAYLGMVAALTRLAISGIARVAHANNRSFEEELNRYLSVLDQHAENGTPTVNAHLPPE